VTGKEVPETKPVCKVYLFKCADNNALAQGSRASNPCEKMEIEDLADKKLKTYCFKAA
jgi:hypothetical protein